MRFTFRCAKTHHHLREDWLATAASTPSSQLSSQHNLPEHSTGASARALAKCPREFFSSGKAWVFPMTAFMAAAAAAAAKRAARGCNFRTIILWNDHSSGLPIVTTWSAAGTLDAIVLCTVDGRRSSHVARRTPQHARRKRPVSVMKRRPPLVKIPAPFPRFRMRCKSIGQAAPGRFMTRGARSRSQSMTE